MKIKYQVESKIKCSEFKQLLISSSLAERRPINEEERLQKMIENANLYVTARLDGKLIGIARSITDFAYCTYLSDLAVDKKYQKLGIGKEIVHFTKSEVPQTLLLLLAAPKAIEYYPKIGMERHNHCFIL